MRIFHELQNKLGFLRVVVFILSLCPNADAPKGWLWCQLVFRAWSCPQVELRIHRECLSPLSELRSFRSVGLGRILEEIPAAYGAVFRISREKPGVPRERAQLRRSFDALERVQIRGRRLGRWRFWIRRQVDGLRYWTARRSARRIGNQRTAGAGQASRYYEKLQGSWKFSYSVEIVMLIFAELGLWGCEEDEAKCVSKELFRQIQRHNVPGWDTNFLSYNEA